MEALKTIIAVDVIFYSVLGATAALFLKVWGVAVKWDNVGSLSGAFGGVLFRSQSFLAYNTINFSQNPLECFFNICGLQSWSFYKRKPFLLWKCLSIISWHTSQMLEIRLVPNQHDHNVGVGVISQLLQPSFNILIGYMLRDVIHQQSSYSATIVRTSDSSVSLLSCCVPDLSFDRLSINLMVMQRNTKN